MSLTNQSTGQGYRPPVYFVVERSRYAAEKSKIVYTPHNCQIPGIYKRGVPMHQAEVNQFNTLYQRHLRLLKLQGKSQKTIDAYSRAVRGVRDHFDCCPDQLTPEQLAIDWLMPTRGVPSKSIETACNCSGGMC